MNLDYIVDGHNHPPGWSVKPSTIGRIADTVEFMDDVQHRRFDIPDPLELIVSQSPYFFKCFAYTMSDEEAEIQTAERVPVLTNSANGADTELVKAYMRTRPQTRLLADFLELLTVLKERPLTVGQIIKRADLEEDETKKLLRRGLYGEVPKIEFVLRKNNVALRLNKIGQAIVDAMA